MIFYRKGVRGQDKKGNDIKYDIAEKIDFAVFPGHQGGPHNHTIAGLAVALKQAMTPEFKEYQQQVMANSAKFAGALQGLGYDLVSGGTDNHLCLVNLRPLGVDGARAERVLELASISTNKNTVPGDTSALNPGGLRMGAPAMTTRGMDENDFVKIAEFVDRGIKIAKGLKAEYPKMKDFRAALDSAPNADIEALREDVETFTKAFTTIGFDAKDLKYQD